MGQILLECLNGYRTSASALANKLDDALASCCSLSSLTGFSSFLLVSQTIKSTVIAVRDYC